MSPDLVRLRIADTGGHGRGAAVMTRERAEALVDLWIRRHGARYELSIESIRPPATAAASPPTEEAPVKWAIVLQLVESCLAFLVGNKVLLTALGVGLGLLLLAVLGIYLPTAHLRVIPVVILGLASFALGLFASKAAAEL